ncbi:hypothetical protein EN875_034015 [Mesorhizobium sp. M2D.F.Ca.ET.232.01.1.1]|uniref:hypothetical protein n=1 Tax=Mesorhizobium sp. M2D.F.Ca.ET.232.01.1.1 TaxID=2496670 RepID=UPI000FCBD6A2|nr:hypothetical protein [Mesorhizobium sp. M2D.F.Ca.ET.232.01.1.1]TGP27358.1 hypothetical protein EN875_034015 [Mesorhizobium sp. M2D.F.Ca.ET.232.01.1.1]
MKPADLLKAHEAAGKRYIAALTELTEAYVELGAYDRALDNTHVRELVGQITGPVNMRSFFGIPDSVPWPLRHPLFWPEAGSNWQDAIKERGDALIADVTA